MTTTEANIDSSDATAEAESSGDNIYLLFASNDHKTIGRLWIATSLIFLVAVSVLSIVTGIERASLDGIDVFSALSDYFQGWTLVRTASVFLVALPLFIGIATVVVPLQVGAGGIAFPRLAAAAFWSWLVASGVHIASFIADGGLGPDFGTSRDATLLTLTSLGFLVVSLLAASLCIATTVIALRPTGMTLLRVPAFSWSMLVATSVWLLSLPVLIANLIYAWADLQGRDPIAFGNPDRLWSDLEWVFQQPQILSFAIPVLGVLAEIGPVSAKVRQANREVLLTLIGLFGALSFGAWAQHAFSRGADPTFEDGNLIYEEALYVLFGLAIFLPTIGVIGGVADTIRRGSVPKPSAALVGATAGALLLLVAVVVGELRVIPLWDALHEDNVLLSSATAQFTAVIAAVTASAVGALAYWSPKIFGGYVKEPLAIMAVLALLAGGVVAAVADIVSAFLGQPDISISSAVDSGVETLNIMATMGLVMMALGAMLLVGSLLTAAGSGEVLPDDPWDGHTLEWAAPSPPPMGNFVEELAPVVSAAPLLDEFEEVS
ncbi:MAG: cbb3-type cytochrome c oxidase subunit I [Acidimicrobiales bacterium]